MPGMAPTPEQLAKQNSLERGEGPKAPKPMIEGEIPTLHPLFRSEISQLVYGISWTYNKKILDHVEILCNTDRTWDIVRRVLMGLMTEEVETSQKVISQKIRELQLKAKEITDGESGTVRADNGNRTAGH